MADDFHHHRRPHLHPIYVPRRTADLSRQTSFSSTVTPETRTRYADSPYTPSIYTTTPSKHRLSITRASAGTAAGSSSVSSILLLLFSLRSLYSLLPFLRSSPPSFSIFPFAFLVSLFSFVLTLGFFLSASTLRKDSKSGWPLFSFSSLTQSQRRCLIAKSLLLGVVFLLRFQALRNCGTAAMILAEFCGNVAARFVREGKENSYGMLSSVGFLKVRGLIALFLGLVLLSVSWDRVECFPFSHLNITNRDFLSLPSANCLRIGSILLPLSSGFLGYFENVSSSLIQLRELGLKKVRVMTLFCTTMFLLIPAMVSMFVFEAEGDSVSLSKLGWPLANTVVFGVLLNENYTNGKVSSHKLTQEEYFVAFFCMLVLEMFYFTELSVCGLLIIGFFIWVAVRELNFMHSSYPELGHDTSETFGKVLMKALSHIFSERKSRKIALFLLINTAYMVVEFVVGFMSNSLGLISDACHMLFDCAALAIGLYASYIARLPANSQFNYGRGRFEVVSGFVNAIFLVLVGAMITLESFERILDPQEISTGSVMVVSIGGLIVNIVGLLFFHEEHHHAHGGSRACSHSHSHSDSDDHNHVHNHACDYKDEHQELVKADFHQSYLNHDVHHGAEGKEQHEISCFISRDHHNEHNDHHDYSHDHHCRNHDHHHHHHHHHKHGNKEVSEKTDKNNHHHHHHIDHNMQGIFLHVLADTMGSVGVVISTLLIKYKGWLVADPACSVFISALIIVSVIPLLTNSAEVLLQRAPRSCEHDIKEALNDVMKLRGVCSIQNLHIWSFTTMEIVATVHLHVSEDADKDSIKIQVSTILHDAGIKDLTLQIESVQ